MLATLVRNARGGLAIEGSAAFPVQSCANRPSRPRREVPDVVAPRYDAPLVPESGRVAFRLQVEEFPQRGMHPRGDLANWPGGSIAKRNMPLFVNTPCVGGW